MTMIRGKSYKSATSDFTVVKDKTFNEAESEASLSRTDEAMKIIYGELSQERQADILGAMGLGRATKAAPDVLRTRLMKFVTEDKDKISVNKEDTNIELFFKLYEKDEEKLNVLAVFHRAKNARIISKVSKGYEFGNIFLGKTIKDSVKFLEESLNSDTLQDIKTALSTSEGE